MTYRPKATTYSGLPQQPTPVPPEVSGEPAPEKEATPKKTSERTAKKRPESSPPASDESKRKAPRTPAASIPPSQILAVLPTPHQTRGTRPAICVLTRQVLPRGSVVFKGISVSPRFGTSYRTLSPDGLAMWLDYGRELLNKIELRAAYLQKTSIDMKWEKGPPGTHRLIVNGKPACVVVQEEAKSFLVTWSGRPTKRRTAITLPRVKRRAEGFIFRRFFRRFEEAFGNMDETREGSSPEENES